MHSRLSRLITLLAILVCLPLQGLAAMTMPSCQAHGQKMEMHVDADQMDAMPGCDQHDTRHKSGNTPCDKCLSCHLVSAQAIIPLTFSMQVTVAAQKFSAAMTEKPQFISSFLFRPPILTLA